MGTKIPSDDGVRGHGASVRLCGHDFLGEFHDGFQIGDGGVVQLAAALFPVAEGGEGEVLYVIEVLNARDSQPPVCFDSVLKYPASYGRVGVVVLTCLPCAWRRGRWEKGSILYEDRDFHGGDRLS